MREEELAYVLYRLSKLELDEGVFEAAFVTSEDPVEVLKGIKDGSSKHVQEPTIGGSITDIDLSLIASGALFPSPSPSVTQILASAARRSPIAHLYELYPHLLALITLPRLSDNAATHTVPYASLDFPSPVLQNNDGIQHHVGRSAQSKISPGSGAPLVPTAVDAKELARTCLQLVGRATSS